MARVCEICGKGPVSGNRIIRKGLRKSKGGIGLHTTGITRRRFLPNIQRVRAVVAGAVQRIHVCTGCIRDGKVTKPTTV